MKYIYNASGDLHEVLEFESKTEWTYYKASDGRRYGASTALLADTAKEAFEKYKTYIASQYKHCKAAEEHYAACARSWFKNMERLLASSKTL